VPAQSIPIFPLSNVVLFPGLQVPLHIFEPRYRQMMRAALAGDRRIGMIAVLPEHVSSISSDPPIYSIGCAGTIEGAQRLPDGRYNIVLRGTHRFRVVRERAPTTGRLYRIAEVELLEDPPSSEHSATARLRVEVLDRFAELMRKLDRSQEGFDSLLQIDDGQLVNSLASGLDFAPREKQALLEANGIHARFEQLSSLLSFALAELEAARTSKSGPLH
jgi:Lon protease-like protein